MSEAMSAAFLPAEKTSTEPKPLRRVSFEQHTGPTKHKGNRKTSLDFAHATTVTSAGHRRTSLESPGGTFNSPRPRLPSTQSSFFNFQAYRTLKLKEAEGSLVISDSSNRPQYIYTRTKKYATLSKFQDGVAQPLIRTRYSHRIMKEADITMLSPTDPDGDVEQANKEHPDVLIPLITVTSDDGSISEGSPTTENTHTPVDSTAPREQHIELMHAPLSSAVTKFTVPAIPYAHGHGRSHHVANATLKWRTRSAMPPFTPPNTTQIRSSLDVSAPAPPESSKLGTKPNGSSGPSRPNSAEEFRTILALTYPTAFDVLAKVILKDDGKLELLMGPEARVNRQAGWDAAGHLVEPLVDESVVLATCLVVLKGLKEGSGFV